MISCCESSRRRFRLMPLARVVLVSGDRAPRRQRTRCDHCCPTRYCPAPCRPWSVSSAVERQHHTIGSTQRDSPSKAERSFHRFRVCAACIVNSSASVVSRLTDRIRSDTASRERVSAIRWRAGECGETRGCGRPGRSAWPHACARTSAAPRRGPDRRCTSVRSPTRSAIGLVGPALAQVAHPARVPCAADIAAETRVGAHGGGQQHPRQ